MENKSQKQFFKHMKNLPVEGTDEYFELIKEEEKKILGGITIDGVYIPGWLYWHLNHWYIRISAPLNSWIVNRP